MATYSVFFETVATTVIDVDADNPFDAEDLAAEKLPTICHVCAGTGMVGTPGIDLGDWEVGDVEKVYDESDEEDE
jgi:hypothetical protein